MTGAYLHDPVEFEVIGVPMPQGSMKAFAVNGQARVKPSGGAGFAAWRPQPGGRRVLRARQRPSTLTTLVPRHLRRGKP